METVRAHPIELSSETPDDLRPLLDFLNSRPIGLEPEGLPDARSARAWLEASGFDLADAALAEDDLGLLRGVRDALAVALDREREDADRAGAWRLLSEIAAASPVTIAFSPDPATRLEPTGTGARRVVEQVLADVQRVVADGRAGRIRICAYEPCSSAFYDTTRSRTQRWHSYAACGNRVNVAAHRTRTTSA
jgi:hypothetical protein